MKINLISGGLDKIETDALIFFVYQNDNFSNEINLINKKLGGIFTDIAKKKYFNGEKNQIYVVHTHGKIIADKIILVGLGEKNKFNNEYLKVRIAEALNYTKNLSVKNCVIVLPEINEISLLDAVTISKISQYGFTNYKTTNLNKIKKIDIIQIYNPKKISIDLKKAILVSEAVNWSRNLINHPSNYITPKKLSTYALSFHGTQIKTKILGKNEMVKEKMGLILGVSKGSDEEPQFIILDYKPSRLRSRQAKNKTLVLVGKGLTFDSGGISLKHAEKMDEMKMDMAGAAVVLGVFKAINQIKPNIRVVGLVPATENMPSGKAIKPGDILTAFSGQTVEIINTDAEGRLVLADALTYAQKYKPDVIVDVATLTGAVVVALGDETAGILGNNQNYIEMIKKSSKTTGEKIWQLPIYDEHREAMKSEIADLKNSSGTKSAGTITGAAFLENFVGDYPWMHLDIAGTAFSSAKPKPYNPKGATGYGIRLILDFIENISI